MHQSSQLRSTSQPRSPTAITDQAEPPVTRNALEPLPYHRCVVKFLKATEPELWNWAASAEVLDTQSDHIRTELLKAGYRLDADAHPELAAHVDIVAQRLGLTAPVTMYQASHEQAMNAMLLFIPGEAHLVFTGPILSILSDAEQEAIIAHELAHYLLWEADDGDYLVADRLLAAAANDPRSANSTEQTARKYRLYTELFADRGSLIGCGQLEASVSALVKAETGFHSVSAASYLRQAEEILSREQTTTKQIDHPELFIRARALKLWSDSSAELDKLLEDTLAGRYALDELDLLQQQEITDYTRRLIANLIQPKWFQTPSVMAHAKLFAPDIQPLKNPDPSFASNLRAVINKSDNSLQEYFAYLLLDFAALDQELEDLPLAATLEWGSHLGLSERFEKIVLKELSLTKKRITKLKTQAPEMLKQMETRS